MSGKYKPPTARSLRLLEGIYQAIGSHQIHERWIIDSKVSVLGLAEPGIITVSPLAFLETFIHEAIHRAEPQWSERAVDCATTYLWGRLSDEDCRRLAAAYLGKVKRIKRPTTSGE